MRRRSLTAKVELGLVLVALVASVLLSGCVLSGTSTTANTGFGAVEVKVSLLGANHGAGQTQTLEEYGLFYSTVRQNVVDVDKDGRDGLLVDDSTTIIDRPGVPHVSYKAAYVAAPSEAGTLTTTLKGLTPGTTYHYRTYTIGKRDSNGKRYLTLSSVGTFATSDPTLKSLAKSSGTLSPTFSKTKYAYTNTISRNTSGSRITVAPTLAGSSVEMKVGSGAFGAARSKLVSVSRGKSKVLTVRVTEPGGIAKDYVITVKRKK